MKQSPNEENYMLFPDDNNSNNASNLKMAGQEVTPLKRLIGKIDEADFFSKIWEKKCKTVNKSFEYSELFQIEQLGQLLSIPRPDINANITMGKMIDGEYHGVVVSLADGSADMCEIYRLWSEGYSLIVPELHQRWEPIVKFTQELSKQFGFKVEANLYYSPTESVAFPPHYDTHDIFVVQLSGEKIWHLYKSRTKLPLKNQRYDLEDPVLQKDLQAKKRVITLKKGDVMYLPRGQVHSAEAKNIPSMHLSIGVHCVRWLDLLKIMFDQSSDSLFLRSSISQECVNNGINKEVIDKISDNIFGTPSDLQKNLQEILHKTKDK